MRVSVDDIEVAQAEGRRELGRVECGAECASLSEANRRGDGVAMECRWGGDGVEMGWRWGEQVAGGMRSRAWPRRVFRQTLQPVNSKHTGRGDEVEMGWRGVESLVVE